jgi:hypothetical protein
MERPPDTLLRYELALSAERMRQAECEIELLGWLPTAATSATLERLGRERAHYAWLLRCLWRSDSPHDRDR